MSWHLRHEWQEGITLGGSTLATCTQCGTLRVSGERPTYYVKPAREQQRIPEHERVTETAPPCLDPTPTRAHRPKRGDLGEDIRDSARRSDQKAGEP